jgi:hypothetical protein
MYTMLAVAKVPEKFNVDYYIAIVTVFPVLMVTVGVLADFARSIPLKKERGWSRPFFYLVSFFYNYTPILSALGTVLGILALMFRYTSAMYQWITLILLAGVIGFVAVASNAYLRALDGKRQAAG